MSARSGWPVPCSVPEQESSGAKPGALTHQLRMARHRMFFSDAKARRDLGYSSRPYREAIADAIAWFRQAGYVR